LNERDTAFHMVFGNRPSVNPSLPDRALSFNPLRLGDEDFGAFLGALPGPAGENLANRPWFSGKDRALVVVLCRSRRHGGLNASRSEGDAAHQGKVLGVSLDTRPYHPLVASTDGPGTDSAADPVPVEANFHTWLTTAHELAHSWGIGDEYGEFSTAAPPDVIAGMADFANLQPRSELLVQVDPAPAPKVLMDTDIKWGKWPRIDAAGVLVQPPTVEDGLVRVRVDLGHLRPFAVTNKVRLRTRPLVRSKTSRAYRISRIDLGTSEMWLAPIGPLPIEPDITSYAATSIVLRPVLGPDGAGNVDDQTFISSDVRAFIQLNGNPTNAHPVAGPGVPPPNDLPNRPCRNVELLVPTPATNFTTSTAPRPPKFSAYTIGVYENGGRYFCGIYRPTGICLMCRQTFQNTANKSQQAYEFCLVCRYAMVDAVDPTLHAQIDKQFIKRYVQGTE
jgi:hypothetical protein